MGALGCRYLALQLPIAPIPADFFFGRTMVVRFVTAMRGSMGRDGRYWYVFYEFLRSNFPPTAKIAIFWNEHPIFNYIFGKVLVSGANNPATTGTHARAMQVLLAPIVNNSSVTLVYS